MSGSDKEVDPEKPFNIHASMAEYLWRPDVIFNEGRDAKRHDVSTSNLALDIQDKFRREEIGINRNKV